MAATQTDSARAGKDAKVPAGTYSDGSPHDQVQYLECKLILKPDPFTSAKVFLDYGKLVKKTAAEFGIGFSDKGIVLKPDLREVLFLDSADFGLYNNAFILRRRIRYEDGFPAGDPEIVFKFRHADEQLAAQLDVRPKIAGQYPHQVQGRGAAPESRSRGVIACCIPIMACSG